MHHYADACPAGRSAGLPDAEVIGGGPRVSVPVTLGPGRVCFAVVVGGVIGDQAAPATVVAEPPDGSNASAQAG